MVKIAALLPIVVLALAGAGAVTVDGTDPVSIGKKKTAYPVTCGTPMKFKTKGPATVIVDVRGKADAVGKPVELDFTRNDKAVSKNSVTLKKSKDAGKGYTALGKIVLSVPEGEQEYTLDCEAPSDIAMSFRTAPKPGKTNLAAAEVPLKKEEATATGDKADGGPTAKSGDGGAPETTPGAGDPNAAYVGLFTPVPAHF